jgi:hypothetical protein
MRALVTNIVRRLSEGWRLADLPSRGHIYRCRCGRSVFFRNSRCLACGAELGYEPTLSEVHALIPGREENTWLIDGAKGVAGIFRRCANFDSPAGCNWLIPATDPLPYCASCRLNRTIPDLKDPDNCRYWRAIENAKRRLVATLLMVRLPVKSKVSEDPERGVMFDFLRSRPGELPVMTMHGAGLITLNVEEANDSFREKVRHELHEPYRTLLGHLRHEIGHYYWDRLIDGTPWLDRFRELFGDERADYSAALRANYENGPRPDWRESYISSYSSAHPWEDWAECWAHYLHMVDSLDTAMGFGLTGANIEVEVKPFLLQDLYAPDDREARRLLSLVNSWMELVTAVNELARSMGQQDFYPFVMTGPVLRKVHFIRLVVREQREAAVKASRKSRR